MRAMPRPARFSYIYTNGTLCARIAPFSSVFFRFSRHRPGSWGIAGRDHRPRCSAARPAPNRFTKTHQSARVLRDCGRSLPQERRISRLLAPAAQSPQCPQKQQHRAMYRPTSRSFCKSWLKPRRKVPIPTNDIGLEPIAASATNTAVRCGRVGRTFRSLRPHDAAFPNGEARPFTRR